MSAPIISYRNHRYPPQIIAHAVWRWGRKFGPAYAKLSRRRRPSRKHIWHPDEGVIAIGGRKHWLWRAVDQDGNILDEIVQARRDHQGCQAIADQTAEKASPQAETHHHR